MAKAIYINGTEETLERPSLGVLTEIVGGYVEPVNINHPDYCIMLVNEDGNFLDLEINPKASALANQPIVGNVVLVTKEEIN